MSADPAEDRLMARIAERLRAAGVDPVYGRLVRQYLLEPGDGWRWCCGSNCDPCSRTLARVVDGLRAEGAAGSARDATT